MILTEYLTAEAIDKKAGGNKRAINKLFRAQDCSNLFPINGKFNVTEKAIREAKKYENLSGCSLEGLEYALFLENRIGEIVNGWHGLYWQ